MGWLVAVGLAALVLAGAGAGAAELRAKIGVVDAQKILENLQSWQEAQARHREQEQKGEKTLSELKKEIGRIEAEMEYFKPGSPDHEKRRAELAARQQKLGQVSTELERSLTEQSKAALEEVQKQIREGVRQYALANGFDIVADARAVYFAVAGCDISLEVAREMNKGYKGGAPPEVPGRAKEER